MNGSKACYFAIVSKTSPYTYLGPRPLVVTPDAGLHTGLALTAFRSLKVSTLLRAASSAMASGKYLRNIVRASCSATTCASCTSSGRGAFPYQADGDDLGDVEDLDIDLRGRHAHDRASLDAFGERRSPTSCEGGERDVGDVGDDRVDTGRRERPDLAGIVDRPHVDAEVLRRGVAHCGVGRGEEA